MSRHARPPLLAAHHRAISIANGGLLALAATVGIANTFAPHADATTPAAMPTAVDATEPVGHGGPLALPTFPTDVWTPDAGPVITDGQPLATAAPTRAQRKQRAEPPVVVTEPTPTPAAPVQEAAPEPPVAAADPPPAPPEDDIEDERDDEPVIGLPDVDEPDDTEPEVTEPTPTELPVDVTVEVAP